MSAPTRGRAQNTWGICGNLKKNDKSEDLDKSREKNSSWRAAPLPPKCHRVPKTMPLCRGGHAPSCCQVSRASELGKVCIVLVDRLCRWAPDFFQKKRRRLVCFFQEKHVVWCAYNPLVLLPNHTRTDNYWYPGLVVNYRELLFVLVFLLFILLFF